MKVAIYDRPGSFSDRWIARCQEEQLEYVLVDLRDSDILNKLREEDCAVLLAHPGMADRSSKLAARSVIRAAEMAGLSVFPTYADFWHFDDKIAQKYMLDAVGARTPRTCIFYSSKDALSWVEDGATYPLVAKLKSGAGAINVSLITGADKASSYIRRMFGVGYPPASSATKDVITKLRTHARNRDWGATIRRLPATFGNYLRYRKELDWERGYAYFQEFIPNNSFDVRVATIGERAFAFKRHVRPGDFRASGSGLIDYDCGREVAACVNEAFRLAERLQLGCMAFDFIFDEAGMPVVVELSFGFVPEAVHGCPGYWTRNGDWREGNFWPQDLVLADTLSRATA